MYVTALDQILSYYTMKMAKHVQKYLTIILQWGKYQYLKMPMGLSISTDVFQQEITKFFDRLKYVLVYIDDVLVLTKGAFKDHLEKIRTMLQQMRKTGMQIKPNKLFFCAHEAKYLGYIIMQEGLQPQKSKVEAIVNMAQPCTVMQLRGFFGSVNFY